MAQFKGTVFISTKMFLEHKFGPEAAQRCLERTGAKNKAILENVSAMGWCPVEPVLRYHHAMEELYGGSNFALCEEAGRFGARWALSTVIRVFLRFKSPHWVMEKHASVWDRNHDSGRWEVDTCGTPNSMRGRLYEFQVRDPAFLRPASGLVAWCGLHDRWPSSRGFGAELPLPG